MSILGNNGQIWCKARLSETILKIYPFELEIKDTADTARPASYLYIHLEIDIEGRLRTKIYD